MYRYRPADYCDRETARCRISPARLRDSGLALGQWVSLVSNRSSTNEDDQIFCRVWPARQDSSVQSDTMLVDRTVYSQKEDDSGFSLDMATVAHSGQRAVTPSTTEERFYETLVVKEGFTVSSLHAGLLIKIQSSTPPNGPVQVVKGTQIIIATQDTTTKTEQDVASNQPKDDLALHSQPNNSINILPGLEGPLKALLEVVSYPLLYPDLISHLNIECPKGILLHGPPGVGKTLLVSTVAQICSATMITIFGPEIFGPYVGESEEKLRQKFAHASRIAVDNPKKPVLIFIDELDALTPHRTDAQAHESRVVAQLLTLMDGVASRGRVVVIAATNRPNAIDPALRRPGRFDREIRMEVPGETNRLKIIKGLIKDMPHLLTNEELNRLARMTNGFVGADLEALCRESALSAVHRSLVTTGCGSEAGAQVKVTMADFKKAFSTNAPSLQRGYGVVVEPVSWSDIGGLETVKTQLRQAVEWPVLYKETFSRLGLKAPRGILLYGPPGCSKTTLVKAIATNSGASFLSVNGAALYSSFVGDSEKTIRETFHQARLSAPSIIFFDEIDTIVGKRNFSSGGGDGGGDSVQERVLSSMLNEMDGVENANGVLIVAATNRVDLIDKALLRPGRFDRVVYVPPPDLEARRQILSIYTRDIPLSDDVDLETIAKTTEFYTGADLQNVCREAALIALRTRILGGPSKPGADQISEDDIPSTEPVNADDFALSLLSVKASLTPAMLLEYSGTGTKAF
ncbi:hypothetical protein BGZ83_000897 [Gryganskiella cystojenkinii]|nr:hypothetical protein BGZ83_000897 [Gryganskiella cystojenkinii]